MALNIDALIPKQHMPESARYRFGKIDVPQSELPTPEELHDAIDDTFRVRNKKVVVEGEDPVELEEKGMNSYYSDARNEYAYCQFTYISDKEDSATVREGDELKVAPDDQPVRPLVFYFNNGQFAYESEQGLIKHWIPNFIGERTDTDIEGKYHFNEFSQATMRDFYDNRDEISVFRFGSTEEEFDDDSTLARALNELAEEVASQEFSGGNPPTNLKGLEIFDEAINKMHILKLRGSRDDAYTTEILSSGMHEIKWSEEEWPNDAGQERRAEAMFQRLSSHLQKLS